MKAPSDHHPINSSGLLTKLLNRGDNISIVQGKLLIKPSSGLAIPPTWLKKNELLLINEICQLSNLIPLRYVSYTTGSYGIKKSQGITLQFINLKTNDDAYVIYNASLKRTRKSKGGNQGDPLPKKQFIVSERSSFYKFWLSIGLPLPKSLSKFYECMGRLKPLIFTGNVNFNNRISSKIIQLLNISHQQILDKKYLASSSEKNTNPTAKEPLIFCQETAKGPLTFTAKDIELDHATIELASNQSTCSSKYGNTVIRKEVISKGVDSDSIPIKTFNNDEIVENTNLVISQNKRPEDQTVDEWLKDWENAFSPDELEAVMTDFNNLQSYSIDKAS